MQLLKDKQTS